MRIRTWSKGYGSWKSTVRFGYAKVYYRLVTNRLCHGILPPTECLLRPSSEHWMIKYWINSISSSRYWISYFMMCISLFLQKHAAWDFIMTSSWTSLPHPFSHRSDQSLPCSNTWIWKEHDWWFRVIILIHNTSNERHEQQKREGEDEDENVETEVRAAPIVELPAAGVVRDKGGVWNDYGRILRSGCSDDDAKYIQCDCCMMANGANMVWAVVSQNGCWSDLTWTLRAELPQRAPQGIEQAIARVVL